MLNSQSVLYRSKDSKVVKARQHNVHKQLEYTVIGRLTTDANVQDDYNQECGTTEMSGLRALWVLAQ